MEYEVNKEELMEKIKSLLVPEISPISFNTYINPLTIESISDNNIVFICKGSFIKDMLENRFAPLILSTISYITNRDFTFSVHDIETKEKENIVAEIPGLENAQEKNKSLLEEKLEDIAEKIGYFRILAGIVTLVALVIRFGISYVNNAKEYDRSIAEQGILDFMYKIIQIKSLIVK